VEVEEALVSPHRLREVQVGRVLAVTEVHQVLMALMEPLIEVEVVVVLAEQVALHLVAAQVAQA
jgi:hypothetical protein